MSFGKEGVVAAIVSFLRRSHDTDVHRATARALHELSRSPDNCITMHRAGAIRVSSLWPIILCKLVGTFVYAVDLRAHIAVIIM